MRIIHLAAELSPYAKVGGLADVVQSLAKECSELGHEIEVILPAYPFLKKFPIPSSFKLTLLDVPDRSFERDKIYGYPDDVQRFARFSKHAADYLRTKSYDVLHLHDWHTALLAAYLPRSLLTIHNLSYMGVCDPSLLHELDVAIEDEFRGEEGYSLLRVGIVKSSLLTTVSKTYANEILHPQYGYSLSDVLKRHQNKLTGIVNGLDMSYWNPATDPMLEHHYDAVYPEEKQIAQSHILEKLGLQPTTKPVVAAITRLVWQKAPYLIAAALEKTVELGGSFILLGSASDPETEAFFLELQKKYEGSASVFFSLTFDEQLSHQIYAAADLLVVPSLFEPCGLTQLIAMRYGTLPLVRKTGGLADTVTDGINGFVFEDPSVTAIHAKLEEAFKLWEHPEEWKKLQSQAFATDVSWKRSAQIYLSLYQRLAQTADSV
ncbi:MAG: glycogen synthase [Verrucomicrobia bacterium]|nr:glycogen synthase [Verrucomicrobiota bacterium]